MALGEERDLVPLGAGFDITKRGYSRMQVEEHLEQLDSQLKILAADRNAAAAQAAELTSQLEVARTTIDDLNKQVERLAQPPTTREGLSERLQRMLRLTQEECEEIRAKANTEADHIRAKANAEADELRGKYEIQLKELDERRIAMEHEHRGVLERISPIHKADRIAAPMMFVHGASDYHPDHRISGEIASDCRIPVTVRLIETEYPHMDKVPHVFIMDNIGAISFEPEVYVDITDTFETKCKMLRCHESQDAWLQHLYGMEYVEFMAKASSLRGMAIGVKYAEAFRSLPMYPVSGGPHLLP